MTDPANPKLTDSLVDAALLLAAVSLAALIHPLAIAVAALVCALTIGALRIRSAALLPRGMGMAGWTLLVFGVYVAASAAWSVDPAFSLMSALPLLLAVLIGLPCVILLAQRGPGIEASWPALLTVAVVAGLIVFEAATGGLLRRMIPGGAGLFALLVAFLTVMIWPMAAMLQVRYSWREALVWIAGGLIAIVLSDHPSFLWAALSGLVAFGIAMASSVLARIVLIFCVLAVGFGPAVLATFVGSGAFELPAQIEPHLSAWPAALSVWASTPIQGTGAGTAVPEMLALPGQSVALQLLIGVGGIGLILGIVAVIAVILRAVTRESSAWRGACAAGLIGAGLAMALSGPGIWQPWWIAALAAAAIGIAGAAPVAAGGASLGSIFDHARAAEEEEEEDDGLYHFDDDDDYDDDYDDDEDENGEWDIDDSQVDRGDTGPRQDAEEKRG
ncbi:hypothetical protein [Pacificispira sp.]|uniref:hypothetical protein n=1 Tax=Pacificispira sp. TaxID=2888761 RepID=UPI003BABB4AF